MRGEDDPTQPGSFAAASKLARAVTLLAGALMNFILAILLFGLLTMLNGIADESRPGAAIRAIAVGSPAEQAGLALGDRIVAADGNPLADSAALSAYTRAHTGQPVTFRFVRGTGAASQNLEVVITPRVNPPANEGALGVGIETLTRPAKIWEAAWNGVLATGEVIAQTFLVPANLIRTGRPLSDAGLMGPVGIARTTGEVVTKALDKQAIGLVILYVALLSAAIGITNLLPIPGLDGGRLIFVLLEAIRRKRIAPAHEGMVHMIGMAMLLLLVGVITVREIGQIATGQFPSLGF